MALEILGSIVGGLWIGYNISWKLSRLMAGSIEYRFIRKDWEGLDERSRDLNPIPSWRECVSSEGVYDNFLRDVEESRGYRRPKIGN